MLNHFREMPSSGVPVFGATVLNCAKTPSVGPPCVITHVGFIGLPIQLE